MTLQVTYDIKSSRFAIISPICPGKRDITLIKLGNYLIQVHIESILDKLLATNGIKLFEREY
jgi:hypothetical protein